ncbi:MAG: class I SAM-dependent methyltransferase [Candidatus Dojkabacteria bacterium]
MDIHEKQKLVTMLDTSWKPQSEHYKERIKDLVTGTTVILDIGCGRTDFMADVFKEAKHVIGQDPDESAILENPCIDQKIIGDFESLDQLEDGSIDLIISAWTLEHLEHPEAMFAQTHRLLKVGGSLIALTPNKNSLITYVSRIIPNKFQAKLVKQFWGREEHNTYPAHYLANSITSIKKLTHLFSLTIHKISLLKDPTYYMLHPSLAKPVHALHKHLIPRKMSEGLLVHIKKL